MHGFVIFLIGFVGGGELARKYVRKTKRKYSSRAFKKQRLQTIATAFLIWFVSIALSTMLGTLANGDGLQVVTSLKFSFIFLLTIVAIGLITQSLNVLFDVYWPIRASKHRTISVKNAWLLLLFGVLVFALAYILRQLVL